MPLPTGTVTFLFTDIEESTGLLHALGDRYRELLRDHHRIVRDAIARHGGREVSTEGDAFFVAFADAAAGVAVAADVQRKLAEHEWPHRGRVRVRMGLHTGTPSLVDGDYVGIDVHRAARIAAAGHGGQVLLSKATRELLPADVATRDLGEHRLKDLREPEWLYQLLIPGVPADFPPLRSLGNTNLPVPTTEIVGREQELEELGALLSDGSRLVTLTGVGGTGKTRLAIAVAWSLVDEFANGVFLIELAPLRDANLVIPTIARIVGAREPEIGALVDALRAKRILLVVDNFEHVLDAALEMASLLIAAPEVKLLATSRAPLRLTAEREYAVAPLAVPEPGESDPAEALASPAVRVLVARMQAVRRDFELSPATAPAVAEISRRLDGLPLALELAAARARHFPPEALLGKLENRLDVLVAGPRDLPERQQTLRAAIDWSFQQLAEEEQRLLARVSVFAGGWTLEAAERVCGAGDALTSLLDGSLVVGSEGEDGEPRFSMLETIREFAVERLRELAEEEAIGRRHASYFVELAQDAETRMRGPEQPALLRMLEREHDNARAAFDWALEHDLETALALGNALQQLWYLHGYAREGLQRLEAALVREDTVSPLVRARALRTAGTLAEGCGELARAGELLGQSIELLRGLDQPKDLATALNNQGAIAIQQADYEAARRLYGESLDLKRALGDTTGILLTTSNLAILEGKDGLYESARRRHEEVLPSLRELGFANAVSNCLASLGETVLLCGDRAEGRAILEESLSLRREVGDKAGIVESLVLLSRADGADGAVAEAEERLREALELAVEIDHRGTLISVIEARGDLELAAGDPSRGLALRAAARRMRSDLGAPFLEADRAWRNQALAQGRRQLSAEDFGRSDAEGESAADGEVLAWARADVGAAIGAHDREERG
jgi:predicted ATPase/class 3 adenylate cyclase